MSGPAVEIRALGKKYKLYRTPADKAFDALGVLPFLFWRRHPYTEFWALRGFDLVLNRGERLGIIGRNGAGKSTLLKLISGTIRPSEGTVTVRGQVSSLMELGTGFHPDFSGRENIRAALAFQGLGGPAIRAAEEEIIDFTELDEFIDRPVRYYSAGMHARLMFAVATSTRPDILIVDEVLGAGDAYFASKCAERMKRLTSETGSTVLFVSHAMSSVIEMCDRAILLERGRVACDGSPLHVSKVYNAKVRAEEELSARAREARVRVKDFKGLHRTDTDFQSHLFRLRTAESTNKSRVRITHLRLLRDNEEVALLEPGAPMDNSSSAPNRIMEGANSCWGTALARPQFHRPLVPTPDSHAPFQLSVPLPVRPGTLAVEVSALAPVEHAVSVEWWDGTAYLILGALELGQQQVTLTIPTNQPETSEVNIQVGAVGDAPEHAIYGSGGVQFSTVEIEDILGISRRVFEMGEALTVRMDLEITQTISSAVFVCCILTATGAVVTQVICPSEDLGFSELSGTETVRVNFEPLRLGAGEYVVSLGVFKNCDMTQEVENESYCVLDRALFFKVHQPEGVKKSLGAFGHPVQWKSEQQTVGYDPVRDPQHAS